MEFVAGSRTPEMAVAHGDDRVQIVASRMAASPIRPMVLLMKRALYSKRAYTREAVLFLVAQNPGQPSASLSAANDLADACLSISQAPDIDQRHRLRAAVLEAVTEHLLRSRHQDVRTEHRACGLDARVYAPDGCSRPLDVVAVADPTEVYECKCSSSHWTSTGQEWDIKQSDLTLFARIGDLAAAENERVLCAFATLLTRQELEEALSGLTAERPVYAATVDDLEQLASRKPAQVQVVS